MDLDTINIGCTVDVYDKEFEEEIVFQLVGSTEANSLEGKISNESPVGKALIGKKVGDVVAERRSEKSGNTAEQWTGTGFESFKKGAP